MKFLAIYKFIFIGLIVFFGHTINAVSTDKKILLGPETYHREPNQRLYSSTFQDTTLKFSLEDAIKEYKNGRFESTDPKKYSGKLSNKLSLWRHIQVRSTITKNYFLELGFAEYITLYICYPDGRVIKKEGGNLYPASKLDSPYLATYFKIEIPKDEDLEIFVHLRNKFPFDIFLTLSFHDVEFFWKETHSRLDKIMYIFLGAVLIMIFYNLLLYITARDQAYFLYVLYMLVIFFTNLIDSRIFHRTFSCFSDYPVQIYILSVIIGQMIGISYISFSRRFINLKKIAPLYDDILRWWFFLRVISIPIVVYLTLGPIGKNFTYYLIVTDIIVGIVNVIVVYRTKHPIGKYFVWGGLALILGATLTVLELYNVYIFGERTFGVPLQAGILSELILFSVGLGIRVKMNEEEKRVTEKKLINQLLENQKLQTEVKTELENKVKERTEEIEQRNFEIMKQNVLLVGQKEELEVKSEAVKKANEEVNMKNEELNISLEKLKIAQAELVQSEKMASLGQLTAGIAHEINNPINFVSANIHPLKNDFFEIKRLFEKYKKLNTSDDPINELRAIKTYEEQIDADYLFEEITLLLNGVEEGAFRTREIVLGLRNFSRMEENNFKPVNIHAGLDSTLMLIQGKIKNRIQVIKNYDENMPLVECFPGKINQVFMNILTNAVQAISDRGEIKLTTQLDQGNAKIIVEDNGEGMSKEVQDKIFEPFFTTKEIGKGTGLGLSISYGIIEDHHGKIEVNSTPGVGSVFIITIPISQPAHKG